MKPSTDKEAITLILTGLTDAGWTVTEVADDTWNTDERTKVYDIGTAVDMVMEVDEAYVFLDGPNPRGQYIYFVLGNDPEEVAADYTIGLDPHLSNITDPWWE